VLVKILKVGVDGTDKEINAAEYGAAPSGYDFLVIGHEGFGQVEAVGPEVTEFKPGDYVVATVRRPGHSIYDAIGESDVTTDSNYYERGINLLHGFLTEYYVDDADFMVKIPVGLKDVGVLLEPMTVVQKGIVQAYEIQRRLKLWRPRKAAVMGAGTIGLLATLVLRLRGLEVVTFARAAKPNLNADLIEALGAKYEITQELPVIEGVRSVRHHFRSNRLLSDCLREHAGAGKKRRIDPFQRHWGGQARRSSSRQDQFGIRSWQQGDGWNCQCKPRILRIRSTRHGDGGIAVPRMA